MKLPISLSIISFLFAMSSTTAQPTDLDEIAAALDTIPLVEISADDPIVVALDKLWADHRMEWLGVELDSVCLNAHNFSFGDVPVYSEAIIAERLALLDSQSPMDLDYNAYVQAFINLYTIRRRDVTSRVLGLAAYYYPLFEEKLDQFDMPLELKHLAVVESALNANAKSRVGATGLWQFMYNTGKMYDLEADSYIDERKDPYASTIAACRFMKALYKMYGDWHLVLAAYNSGPGNVNKAIRRSGGHRDYWKIRPYLPKETAGYVPAFIAVNYVMNHAADHNIFPTRPSYLYTDVDTLQICKSVRIDQVAYFAGMTVDQVALLNPRYKTSTIPANGSCNTLYLPNEAIGSFLANFESLEQYQPAPVEASIAQAEPEKTQKTHTVRSGDSLGKIANKYGVTTKQLIAWNRLKSTNIQPGQKLKIEVAEIRSTTTARAETKTEPKREDSGTKTANPELGSMKVHIVQSGDTLWDIANRYPGISVNDIKAANSGLNIKSLKPGQKIKIPQGT